MNKITWVITPSFFSILIFFTVLPNHYFSFPDQFLWGVATAEYQLSGAYHCPNSNWAAWEQTTDQQGNPHIANNDSSGKACDHWNRYIDDIQLMKNLGIKAYRFSVEWSRIEPIEGVFDNVAIEHYIHLCQALHAAGIQPIVTLHHFTHPMWFENKGAFENEKNIVYLVRFAKLIFEKLQPYVQLWCTINEPVGYAVQGYVRGIFPPGEKNYKKLLPVIQNLMKAHVAIYHALKQLPGGQTAQIGLVKCIFQFKPYHPWNPIEQLICTKMNEVTNELIVNFFKTGRLQFSVPCVTRVNYYDPSAPETLDFIGLNYYSHIPIQFNPFDKEIIKEKFHAHEIMTDMPLAIYPQGLYQAIKYISQLNVPIYITENGIADALDDRRELFIKEYLSELAHALQDGYDVRGYFYWSLMDNFEWAEGKAMRFGLYHVDYKTQKRTLRDGAHYFVDVIKNNRLT